METNNLHLNNNNAAVVMTTQNLSFNDSFIEPRDRHQQVMIISLAITIPIAVIGSIGNIITIIAIATTPKLRNIHTIFIMNLCASDVLLCTVSIPLFNISHFATGWIQTNLMVCRISLYLFYCNGGATIMALLLIAVDRNITTVYPQSHTSVFTKKHIKIMLVAAWSFCPLLLLLPLTNTWGRFDYDPSIGLCVMIREPGFSFNKFFFAFIFLSTMTCIIGCYLQIFVIVRRSKQRLYGQRGMHQPTVTSTAVKHYKQQEMKLTKMMVIIFCIFVICYAPQTISHLAGGSAIKIPALRMIGGAMLWLSSCLNPFVYAIMNTELRRSYCRILHCCCNRDNKQKKRMSISMAATVRHNTPPLDAITVANNDKINKLEYQNFKDDMSKDVML
ncbi:unnamed protein product [Owenia fusiformis]|uniref:Uncharacterized protein n=1 Tax=Owenia fusiformis TaxID=6347 RepID=A0A8J1TZB8_OWEFU|nr:unnamed protein product [Owenia fusiformis]